MGIQKIDLKWLTASRLFFIVMVLLEVAFLYELARSPLSSEQLSVFFLRTDDFLADFFNVQIYIADWDPYRNTVNGPSEKCYLPLTYWLMELFNRFYQYSGASLQDCYTSKPALLSCMMFVMLSTAALFHSLSKLVHLATWQKLTVFFTSVMLFSIERANIIILCAAMVCYYLAYMNSPVKWKRIFALLCLCVVSVIKIYPFLLGLFLLKDRRYKAIAACVVMTLLLIFVPFTFFKGGLDNIDQLLLNLETFAENYDPFRRFARFGLPSLVAWLSQRYHVDTVTTFQLIDYAKYATMLLAALSLLLFFLVQRPWQKLALVVIPIVMVPANSAMYCGLYMFPVILWFIERDSRRIWDYFYALLFCILLNPYQIEPLDNFFSAAVLSNIALLLLWLLVIGESCFSAFRAIKSHSIGSSILHDNGFD